MDPAPAATRALSAAEQMRLLRNEIEFLEADIAEKEWRVRLLIEDNAEIDFLVAVNERVIADGVLEDYRRNVGRIALLRGEIESARQDIRTYRRVLAERFGEASS
jgi:uncharacterized small protein (DUF1192 family)